jgi:hypothetical protein
MWPAPQKNKDNKMNARKIASAYRELVSKIRQKKLQVKVPQLVSAANPKAYNITGLSIVYFYLNLRKIVTKESLVLFLRRHGCCKIHSPNPRHFGMQNGFMFLVKNSFHPQYRRLLQPGEYCLYSITKAHPNFECNHRKEKVTKCGFEALRAQFSHRCAVCGSSEGQANLKNSAVRTVLERGHMHPRKPLTVANCIPICTVCNQVYQDRFVFNKRGIIVECLACPKKKKNI